MKPVRFAPPGRLHPLTPAPPLRPPLLLPHQVLYAMRGQAAAFAMLVAHQACPIRSVRADVDQLRRLLLAASLVAVALPATAELAEVLRFGAISPLHLPYISPISPLHLQVLRFGVAAGAGGGGAAAPLAAAPFCGPRSDAYEVFPTLTLTLSLSLSLSLTLALTLTLTLTRTRSSTAYSTRATRS